ncbi:hypothetical protein [Micromonospora wenchangensis]|uniref:hypothetical protein n=1 Tax=Micromonospora wenchangensis TaxID=1185415 RepID=UPI0038263891
MTAWVERGHSLLLWSNELLFFAVICWGAGARGLFSAARPGPSARIDVGGTALTVALVALVVVLLAVGRLVYPVFEIDLSTEVVALVVSSTFGALHVAFLGFAVAAVTLSWSTRAGLIGRAVGIVAPIDRECDQSGLIRTCGRRLSSSRLLVSGYSPTFPVAQ